MSYSFILDKPNSDKPTYILLLMPCSDDRAKRSIKEQILPGHWDSVFQMPKPIKDKEEDYKAARRKITRIKDGLDDYIRECKRENKPLLKADVLALVDHLSGKAKKNDKGNFYEVAELIIKEMREGLILTPQGKRYTEATLINYDQCVRAMKEHRPSLRVADITMDLYNSFVQKLFADNLSLSAAGTHIKCLKRMMGLAHDKGWHQNMTYRDKKFKTLNEETEDIALDESELKKMYEREITDTTQELARDWFILDCFTGLRISDIKSLDKGNIGKSTIIIANEKTDVKVEIPIHHYVRQILKKYGGLPPKISEQEINREIKKVGELCGIDETVLYSITKGGKRVDHYLPKYKMISNHTARRSFITNLRKNGVPDTIVMKLAGIKKPSTLQRYDKLSSKEAATIAAAHPFFSSNR